MCGLIGVAGDITKSEKIIFANMFFLNVLRGSHGCGMLKLYKNDGKNKKKKKYKYLYSPRWSSKPSSEFVQTKEFEDWIETAGCHILMGHSRHATVGKVTVENNHPFIFPEDGDDREDPVIVGMQNGTIRGTFTGRDRHEVDSKALFHLVSEVGLKKALVDLHEKSYNFSYALSIYNNIDSSISLIRNRERPLYIGKSRGDIFWASEDNFLEFAFKRAKRDDYTIHEVEVGSLVKIFPLKDGKERLKIIPKYIDDSKIKKDWGVSSHYSYGYSYNHGASGGSWSERWGRPLQKSLPHMKKGDEEYEVVTGKYFPFFSPKFGVTYHVGSKVYPAWKFESEIMSQGCAYCGKGVTYLPELRVDPNEHKSLLCKECSETDRELASMWYTFTPVIIRKGNRILGCGDYYKLTSRQQVALENLNV